MKEMAGGSFTLRIKSSDVAMLIASKRAQNLPFFTASS